MLVMLWVALAKALQLNWIILSVSQALFAGLFRVVLMSALAAIASNTAIVNPKIKFLGFIFSVKKERK
jgi:hypothetical protein